jgi:hypothetical protein
MFWIKDSRGMLSKVLTPSLTLSNPGSHTNRRPTLTLRTYPSLQGGNDKSRSTESFDCPYKSPQVVPRPLELRNRLKYLLQRDGSAQIRLLSKLNKKYEAYAANEGKWRLDRPIVSGIYMSVCTNIYVFVLQVQASIVKLGLPQITFRGK